MRNRFILLALVALFLCSCKPVKQYPYFQDWRDAVGDTVCEGSDLVFKKKDKFKLVVICDDPELSRPFNLRPESTLSHNTVVNMASYLSYDVDSEGNIEIPKLGKIHVEGMTRAELIALVKEKLISEGFIKNPSVYVEYVDMKVTLLGEIKSGNYLLTKDRTTVLEVLATAGDLGGLARRPDVLLIRQEDGVENFYTLNMDSIQVLQKSPAYYVQQNDVIYVQPTKRQARNTVVNGNNLLSIAFYVSLASLLISLLTYFKL